MYTMASFFAGVGGIDLGFLQAGKCKTIYANEFDRYACETYKANFPDVYLDTRDIHDVKGSEVPCVDIIAGGFPCQAFSIAGKQEGFSDSHGRGTLFFEMARIIKEKRPRVAFFENVKNLVSHDNGNTFRVICDELDKLGYHYTYKVLNATEYGNLPQNRERVYIIAFRDINDYARFRWPEPIRLTCTVKDIIDFETEQDKRYYYTPGKYSNNAILTKYLEEATKDDDINSPYVYQRRRTYVRKCKAGIIPTLTASQGMGGNNVCIIKARHGLRKMTPRECFMAMGFPESFILPEGMSNAQLYKQSGNSVCVPVIKRVAESVFKAMGGS